MRTVTVVGASLAGASAARALRTQGYEGRIVVVGSERHMPYDRPPLSKEYLQGKVNRASLRLLDDEETSGLEVEWRLGETAVGLDTASRAVRLASGRDVATDGVVIATGATPRSVPSASPEPGPAGVHTLRSVDDADRLRAALLSGNLRVVVIGAGFIGAEVAATCHTLDLGLEVTIVEALDIPLVEALGPQMGAVCAALHADHGVRLISGIGVTGLLGQDHVTGVQLADGRILDADVVVVGIGVRPVVDWLVGSGVRLGNGVVCDGGCVTTVPQVVAAGDVAESVSGFTGGPLRVEHWTNALEQPSVAVRNLLAGATVETWSAVPYFWSEQYGVRIQFAGRALPGDQVRVIEGDVERRSFLAVYSRADQPVAVLALDQPRLFTRLRRTLVPGVVPMAS